MKNVVFLVKNGIGFGHIRRAIILAEALLDADQVHPLIISQASSTALFADARAPVVNFPLLHRVPSAIAEDWYTDVLDALLWQLGPAVVIEDTYPDKRYSGLPSLADRPRLLVLRRLDNSSFDTIRTTGAFARYDQILIAQDHESFARENHSHETQTAVTSSGRFDLIGPIFRAPTAAETDAVRAEYAPDGLPLVVVNGGAGGDQMPDGYGDRLFHACVTVAAQLAAEGAAVRFVLVTGPYYAGRPLQERENMVVRRFEPRLHALLNIAHVAVIKPGNNALSEALAGGAHLILVPDVSFMEGTSEHAARVVAQYGGHLAVPDAAALDPLIRKALAQPPRVARLSQAPSEAIAKVTATVHRHVGDMGVTLDPYQLLLIVQTSAAGAVRCPGAVVASDDNPAWADLLTEATTVRADPRRPERFQRHLRFVHERTRRICVQLDLRGITASAQAQEYLDQVAGWLRTQPVQLMSIPDYRTALARRHLEAT